MFGPKYGTYTPWEQGAAHRFDIVGFPRGKLLLEAQMTLMTFLRRIVEQLTNGATSTGADNWISTISTGLKMNGDAAAWSNFVHTPFLAPPRFNVDALVDLTKARVAGTGDHLWLIQAEAPYLKRYIRKLSQMYSVENAGHKDLALSIINWEIQSDVNRHWFWRGTLLEFENLKAFYNRYRDSVDPGQPLPKKVDDMLGALELVLVNAIHDRSKELHAIIVQRPGFRNNYVYENNMHKNASGMYEAAIRFKKFGRTEQEGLANVYRMERLWWILGQLQGEPDSHTRFRYPMLLDMLDQHLATCEPAEGARLDEILYDGLSDYTTLLELLWSVRLHSPRNTIRTTFDCEKTEDRIIWRAAKGAQSMHIPEYDATIRALKIFQLSKVQAGPRNHEWLQHFNNLHKSMQNFWEKLSTSYRTAYEKNGFSSADITFSMAPLYAWKDETYTARLATKQTQIKADTQKPSVSSNDSLFLPLPHSSDATPDPVVQQHSIPKPKTHGVPQPEHPKQAEKSPSTPAAAGKTIPLSKASLKTLRCMFPATIVERQKKITWSVLVASMDEAGFAARNGGGSIVKFEDRSGDGSIVFHRPHPETHVDPVMLQATGWRMNKWFAWDREALVLARK